MKEVSGYKVMSTAALNELEEKNQSLIDSTYQLESNLAFVTVFKDKTAIILPGKGDKEGLFFENTEALNKMVESGVYPVKGDGSFWERQKSRVLNFANEMDYYCSRLSEMLNFKVELRNDPQYLKELSQIITLKFSTKPKRIDKNLYCYLAIYVGELLRRKVDGAWKFLPIYSLNVYYQPEIVSNGKFCDHWGFIIGQLEMASFLPVDIEGLIERLEGDFFPVDSRRYAQI
ncbi:hypothetical protein A4H97_21660 [Niastella yeongjuensis]|uniref:Uncharacterized protein n=1 Tax=Niastella yeongjuensis TaxID=354355 RepID=A0A1V9F848_9BACT|nr:hypothetical protein [Niastella yeongjuensis]OQP54579.1 hypothetical protein A4H97_21660 [Niastella yeongjuensis]SEN99529.1 hypothetical protein SAMN05660816_01845 [Niastella yeongjuensis]